MLITNRSGFTIVELLIVIVVIGILASLGVVGYKGVTERAESTKTQSNLSKAKDFIETKDLASGLYPASMSGFTGDSGVTFTYIPAGDRKSYCLGAVGSKQNAKSYKVIQEGKVSEGTCVEPPFDGPSTGYQANTCVPTDMYAPDPRPYTVISFNVEPNTVYPNLNITVHLYSSSGSSIQTIQAPNEPNYRTTAGEFSYGLGNGYDEAVELEIEVAYIKPNGVQSDTYLATIPNTIVYQSNCSGYSE